MTQSPDAGARFAPPQPGRWQLDAASFASGNATRDADVVAPVLLDAPAHLEITYRGTRARPDGARFVVDGTFCAHGVTRPLECVVESVRLEAGRARFEATARLDRFDYAITAKRGMVGRLVAVTIAAAAVPA